MDLTSIALNQALDYLGTFSPALYDEAQRIRHTLDAPPRIVVVGRLKSGKSTLVNALIGAPVAETAALEATNVVTVFQYGAPDRAEAVLLNGERLPITIQRGEVAALPAPVEEISFIHRWMPTASIKDFSLIDTPGLATLTVENEQRTRRILIDGYEQTKAMSVDADAAVFLFDATPRMDEVKFIKDLGFTSLNTLGVLSRADSFGEGALGERDPLEHARQHADTLAAQLSGSVLTVIPVAGLLAETSHTGVITENDARVMASLAEATEFDLIDIIASEGDAGEGGTGGGGAVEGGAGGGGAGGTQQRCRTHWRIWALPRPQRRPPRCQRTQRMGHHQIRGTRAAAITGYALWQVRHHTPCGAHSQRNRKPGL